MSAVSSVSDAFGSSYVGNSIPSGTFSLSDTSVGIMSGNPAFDTATSSLKKGSSTKPTGERLEFTRPRYSSDDVNDRGTHAYITLLTSPEQASMYATNSSPRNQGSEISCTDGALDTSLSNMTSGSGTGYDKFLITSIQANIDEKLQIMEVFGDNEVAYYFGRAPMIFNISGTLIDSPDNSWFTDWLQTYAGALRGSQLAKNFELLKLVLPNMTLVGSMSSVGWEQTSQNDVTIPFRFQFVVKNLIPTPVLPIGSAITNAAQSISFDSLDSFMTQTGINSLRNQGASLMSVVQNPLSTLGDYGTAMRGFGSGVSASLGLSGTSSAVSDFIDGITSSIGSGLSDIKGIFSPIISTLEGIRASIFSPIYGVMNSLTKLVRTVFGLGGLSSILGALTAPIKNILGDITRIATQASAIVGLVTSGITGFGRSVSSGFGIVQNYQSAVRAIGKASGTIAAAPTTVSDSLRAMFNGGTMSSSAEFLKSNPKHSLSRPASLPSLHLSNASGSADLSISTIKQSPQLAILGSGAKRTVQLGAEL